MRSLSFVQAQHFRVAPESRATRNLPPEGSSISGLLTIRPQYVGWVSSSCSSQLPVAAREVSGDKADKWTGNASLQELLSSHRAARLSDVSAHLWAMGIYMVPQDSYFQIPPTMVRSTWIFNNSDGSALNGSCARTTRSASRPG
jgi:hypothetical protein